VRACANHLARCNYRARPRQASGLNGYEAARGSSEARDFTPERTPRHSITWMCRSLSAALPYWRGHEGLGPAATSDRYGRFLGRRPLLCPVLGSAPASGRSSGRCPLSPARRQHGRAADSQWDPRPQTTGGLHRGWMVGENRPAGARHALDTPQGPHAVRSASSRFASHAKGRRSCVEDRRVQAVANTLLTKESDYDLRS
jgi:hypothetical protein